MLQRLLLLGLMSTFAACDATIDALQIPIDELPVIVTAAIASEWPGATILEAEYEDDIYEVEIQTPDGETLEVELDEDGNILDVDIEEDKHFDDWDFDDGDFDDRDFDD